jgi:hypothetical protein
MARSYLTYECPDDLLVEMGLCDAVPRKGEEISVDGRRFFVASVKWYVSTDVHNRETYPLDYFPAQCAAVRLTKRRP